jgi:peptide chain release factor 3
VVVTTAAPSPSAAGSAAQEAARRRTFAVISHPDAGKSTLTEALALHARVIQEAGAIHGKAGRKSTVSDWMDMEKARGISISSAALQFAYGDSVINLLDTPGHADFSEDTYRVLAAVDCAVMLLDAAKGLEPQTMKLFDVCKHRGIPIITVVNKWDRPGLEALQLMDEIRDRTGLEPTPLTWPVGIAGDFKGVLDRESGDFIRFTRTAGGATIAPEERLPADVAAQQEPEYWQTAVEESELLSAMGQVHEQSTFRGGITTPVLFGSAVLNFGVHQLLDTLLALAPAPGPAAGPEGRASGRWTALQRLRLQDPGRHGLAPPRPARLRAGLLRRVRARHRSSPTPRPASRSPPSTPSRSSAATARPSTWPTRATSSAWSTPARCASATACTSRSRSPSRRSRASRPEHFAVCRAVDAGRYKQFRRGIEQLEQEGTVQVLRSDLRGDQAPVLAAVGPMQFEVAEHRMAAEFSAEVRLDRLEYSLARLTDARWAAVLDRESGVEVLQRTSDGALLALFAGNWRLQRVLRDHPDVLLEPLVAASS